MPRRWGRFREKGSHMRTTNRLRWLVRAMVLWLAIATDAAARESVDYVLSPSAIASVSIEESDARLGPIYFRVVVHVTDVETRRLAVLTRENVEKELKILWDGQVLFTPIIRDEVRDGTLEIPRRTKEDAEALARRLREAPESKPPQ